MIEKLEELMSLLLHNILAEKFMGLHGSQLAQSFYQHLFEFLQEQHLWLYFWSLQNLDQIISLINKIQIIRLGLMSEFY